MARIRSVKPEYFQDQDLVYEVPKRDARLLYIGLWCQSDEHSRMRGDSVWVKGQVFPYDQDITPEYVDELLDMLEDCGRVIRYRVRHSVYLFLPKLAEHQRLEPNKVASRLPDPPDDLGKLFGADKSEKFPDESAPRADKYALLHGSGSMLHGSDRRRADNSAPPPGAETAARLILDATACTPELAAETALTIHRTFKPRSLAAYVRTLIREHQLAEWLSKAQATLDAETKPPPAIGRALVAPTQLLPMIGSVPDLSDTKQAIADAKKKHRERKTG